MWRMNSSTVCSLGNLVVEATLVVPAFAVEADGAGAGFAGTGFFAETEGV
jgi:hypothetical protein